MAFKLLLLFGILGAELTNSACSLSLKLVPDVEYQIDIQRVQKTEKTQFINISSFTDGFENDMDVKLEKAPGVQPGTFVKF